MGLDGSWDVTLHTPQGDQRVSLALVTDPPGGTMSGADGVSTELMDLAVDGDSATWRARITQPMPMLIDFSASVSADAMTGTATAASVIRIPFDGTRS